MIDSLSFGRTGVIPVPTVRVWSKEDRAYLRIISDNALFFCHALVRYGEETVFYLFLNMSEDGPK